MSAICGLVLVKPYKDSKCEPDYFNFLSFFPSTFFLMASASQIPPQAADTLESLVKKALRWLLDEVNRFCLYWIFVSTLAGGVRTHQRLETLWASLATKYHSTNPPPPTL